MKEYMFIFMMSLKNKSKIGLKIIQENIIYFKSLHTIYR